MGIKQQYDRYTAITEILQCPLCGGPAEFFNVNSLKCLSGHCFDLAKQGYINFVPGQSMRQSNYTVELFDARRRIFEAGFYDEAADALVGRVVDSLMVQDSDSARGQQVQDGDSARGQQVQVADSARGQQVQDADCSIPGPVILDAGAGEGFYAGRIAAAIPDMTVIALDNIKDGVIAGAKLHKDVYWTVGDLAALPIRDDTVDVIINVFAPANYGEFRRVLKAGGRVIKAVPGPAYLHELRELAAGQLRNSDYSNEDVVELFRSRVKDFNSQRVKYTLPVSPSQIHDLAMMTPMLSDVDIEALPLATLREITIEWHILTGKMK